MKALAIVNFDQVFLSNKFGVWTTHEAFLRSLDTTQ